MAGWPNRTVDWYLAALGDPDPRLRRQVIAALQVLGDARAVAPIIAALQDDVAEVRATAARALGALGGAAVLAPLRAALRDPDPGPREQAAWALGQLRDRESLDPLLAALGDDDGTVRYAAQRALALIDAGQERAVRPLLDALRRGGEYDGPSLAVALGMVGGSAVLPLIEALRDPLPHVRAAAATALVWPKDSRAIAPLQAALADPEDVVRVAAMFSLRHLAGGSAVPRTREEDVPC